MLYIATKMQELNFSQLMAVYEEGNRENGEIFYPDLPEGQQLLRAEQSFYEYLREGFFPVSGAVYAIWIENECYVSALRLEPYEDGLLLEALETAPTQRRKGYAEKLIRAVLEQFPQKIYSHVSKKNTASLAVHEKCGFVQVLDYAKYIDGSVARNAVTLCSR
jgi:GNAT superfamily N-acetyltransferase